MIYEVQSDNDLSKTIRLLKKEDKTFYVLFTNQSDPKCTYLENLINESHRIIAPEHLGFVPDLVIVDSFECPSGFTLGNFHITKTPTLVVFEFNKLFGWDVWQEEWVTHIEQELGLV